jgi:hypothetical protein
MAAATPDFVTRVNALAAALGTDIKSALGLITETNADIGDINQLSTTVKTSLVAGLNEVKAQVQAIDVSSIIHDNQTGTNTTWSSTKIVAQVQAAVDGIVSGAPGVLNTLKELADALGNNPQVVDQILAVQAKSVRVDVAQNFTAPEKAQGRSNIDAASDAALTEHVASTGNIAGADFVATYTAAKAA